MGTFRIGTSPENTTRAEKIRAHLETCDAELHRMFDRDADYKEIQGYLECANLFARLEIAAQLAELNEKLHAIAESVVLGTKVR